MAHPGLDTSPSASPLLVVGPAWVGDMVMAHTLVQLLARRYPDQSIHMLAPQSAAPIARRMAEVSQVHLMPVGHGVFGWNERREVAETLAAFEYERAWVLPNSWKSALVPWFAKIPERIGWRGELRWGLLTHAPKLDKIAYPLMIERFMALADDQQGLPRPPYPLPKLTVDQAGLETLCAQHQLLPDSRTVVLAPGAEFGPAKRWPAEHFIELALQMADAHWQVVLLGSPADADVCNKIAQAVPGAINLAGQTSLEQAIDVLSLAHRAVCNDSGLMHVARAVGVPTVGLFGSTSPGFTPPLPVGHKDARVAQIELPCRPCFARECPLGHLNCLHQLEPQQVLEQVLA